jgi:hemerythrin
MASLQWTDDLAVGVAEIDGQHRELFGRAARLIEGLRLGEPEDIGELLRYLHEYVVEHFGAEEALMREVRYAGYQRHKAQHDRFVSDLRDLAREYDRKGPGAFLSLQVNHWLEQWLKQHVTQVDAELAKLLRRGQRSA